MDRSSFNFVGSTNDFEKRQAHKAKLAGRIEPPKSKELPAMDPTFNGVSPGGKLVHPSLGEGILVEVDHSKNEVIIDFGAKGLIGLVLSQAKSFVHAPVGIIEKGVAGKDDAFIGSEIQSRMLSPQNRDHRPLDFSKVISSDFIVPETQSIPVGSQVWHPELGVCSVVSVDEKKNSIVLNDSSVNVNVDMVLSQVRSKLIPVDGSPEHVPVKPLVSQQLGIKAPQYKSRGDVSVSLPEVFKSWHRQQQHMFLTRSQSLTTEQANDVFAVLDGNKPMFHSITVGWQTEEETQASIIPGPMKNLKSASVKDFPGILQHENLWHPDFGECSVSSVDGNELVLLTSVGQIPCILDSTVPKLAVLTASGWAQHAAPKNFRTTRVLTPSENSATERPKVSVTLPVAFATWRQLEQYQFLTRQVAPEQANDIISAVAGSLRSSNNEYEITWTDQLPEANKRVEHKEQLLKRVETASITPSAPVVSKPIDPGIQRIIEEISTVKRGSVTKVTVPLPTDFNTWTSSGQYVYLTRTKHLTFNEANDVMDTLQDKTIKSSTQYSVVWGQSDPTAYAIGSDVQRTVEEFDVVEKSSVLKKIRVTLPVDFKNWSESNQYSFLTRASKLTFAEANDVVNTIHGKSFSSKVEYEIVWSA